MILPSSSQADISSRVSSVQCHVMWICTCWLFIYLFDLMIQEFNLRSAPLCLHLPQSEESRACQTLLWDLITRHYTQPLPLRVYLDCVGPLAHTVVLLWPGLSETVVDQWLHMTGRRSNEYAYLPARSQSEADILPGPKSDNSKFLILLFCYTMP